MYNTFGYISTQRLLIPACKYALDLSSLSFNVQSSSRVLVRLRHVHQRPRFHAALLTLIWCVFCLLMFSRVFCLAVDPIVLIHHGASVVR